MNRRSDTSVTILIVAILLCSAFTVICGTVAGADNVRYGIYVKNPDGWTLQDELYLSKFYETVTVDLSGALPDADSEYKVRIVQNGGIAAHIDYVALDAAGSTIAPSFAICVDDGANVLRKVKELDHDVADAGGKTIECTWASGSASSVLLLNANQESSTIEAPVLTPRVMAPALMLPYTIQSNGAIRIDGVPDALGDADFSDFWVPTSGHPSGYTYVWLRSDGEYLYGILEVTGDNTYDETGWGRLYVYADSELKDFRVDADSHEYGLDGFVYTDTVPWQHMVYEFKIPLVEIGASVGDSVKIGFGSYGTFLEQTAEKWVWDPESGDWAEELTAKIGDVLRFKCTINISGYGNLSQIRFWDILDCSLNYSGNATLTYPVPESRATQDVTLCGNYIFKPQVLHPDNLSWNTSSPAIGYDTGENFTELCPDTGHRHRLVTWDDTYPYDRISACDQVYLVSAPAPYHVENVPYTLLINNTELGCMYIDSVLDYESVDLTNPNGSEWLGVCCCKDRYNLVAWSDLNDTDALNEGDTIVLQNKRTGVESEYTVEEVTRDLVVSKEWDVDKLLASTLVLAGGESITFEYNATVVRCGVDNNTFQFKGNFSGVRYYSLPDVVTITVLCQSGDATDAIGLVKDVYTTTEDVYALGSGFDPIYNGTMDIYIFDDLTWTEGLDIGTLPTPYAVLPNALIDDDGNVGPVKIWDKGETFIGEFDMFFDANGNGIYESACDAVDHPNHPGFSIRGAAPALTPVGIAVLVGLLSVIFVLTAVRRKGR